MPFMNIDQFRTDFKKALEASGKSVFAVARERNVQQASLSRFLAGRTGLNAETLLALYPFVYPGGRPSTDNHPAA